uniref:Uncharacterized protein n=1 Tax=Nelumbo nucifera TaxID=4432 RepID=A0A822YIW1_NELNU|nr:TPA_asm: hypothetical protein HUJ06_011283 [Nelumbo nucifera]
MCCCPRTRETRLPEMDANKTQTWRITVRARAKSFDFKFRASRLLSSCRLFESRFSLRVKLRGFLFKVKSETADSELGHAGWPSMKSKFLRFVGKFRGRRAEKKVTSDAKIPKFRNRENKSTTKHLINSSIVEDVAFLSRPITEKDLKEILIHIFTLLINLSMLLKKCLATRPNFSAIVAAVVTCLVGFSLNQLNLGGHITNAAWKVWNRFVYLSY